MFKHDNSTNTEQYTPNPHHTISSEAALRKLIPSYPKVMDKRIQLGLDFFSREFMTQACIAILGTSNDTIPMAPVDCKTQLNIKSDRQIELSNLRHIGSLQSSHGRENPCQASLLLMVQGIGHSLRMNGQLESLTDQKALFTITGVYFHCARAAARSDFWRYSNHPTGLKISAENILRYSPYVLLKTMNREGQTELSPRGDEAGFIKAINKNTLFMPERPGNKVAISLRNIIKNPNIEILVMVPGCLHTQNIHAQAYVTNDTTLLERCAVNGKTPKTGIIINVTNHNFQIDEVLVKSDLWDATKAVDKKTLTAFPKALSSHMNGTGLMGKATNSVVGAIVKHDMKNLY